MLSEKPNRPRLTRAVPRLRGVTSQGRRPRRALRLALATALGASALLAVPQATSAGPVDDQPTVAEAAPLIDEPLTGAEAISALGDDLDVAADRNDLGTSELRTLLRDDTAAWVDTAGIVYFVDPASAIPAPATATPAAGASTPAATAPLSQTFSLHSNPGANLTILLDFDGATVSGTQWNTESGVTTGAQPAWDPAGNGATFTDSERLRVQQVWAMVAEDYAPFNVDVTTEDAGTDRILRSSSADSVYGTRVLVTPSVAARTKICPEGCGGVAYLNVFGETGGSYQPAWIFPQELGNDTKAVAEAASHEAGHNLNLEHDGNSAEGYDMGHGIWAPIMGAGYDRPLVQWSSGSYTDADNQQDDVAILTGFLGAKPDEASGSVATPSPLPDGTRTIGTRTDVDAYLLGACAANSQVTISPAAMAPNLDIRAVLYDASGVQRAVSQPVSTTGDGTTAGGLGATFTMSGVGDGWVVVVEGAGQGTWASNGYDDYGSLGAYTVAAPGCDGDVAAGTPSEPTNVAPGAVGQTSASLSWSAPATSTGGPVTAYVVTRSGSATSQTLAADARSHTFTGLTPGTAYQLSVRATNAVGAGRTVTVAATTSPPTAAAPSSPQDLTASYQSPSGRIEAYWTEPASSGTQPISGYAIYLDGTYLGTLGSASHGVAISGDTPAGLAPGKHTVGVAAVSSVGQSPTATTTVTVPTVPAAPAAVKVVRGDRSARLSWSVPSANGSAITGYTIRGGERTVTTSGTTTSLSLGGLANGRLYRLTVTASNAVGQGSASASVAVVPSGRPATVSRPSAKAGKRQVTIRWKAPSANGSVITSYVVRRSDGAVRTVKGSARTYRWKGLKKGKRYSFSVVARNQVGTGKASGASKKVKVT